MIRLPERLPKSPDLDLTTEKARIWAVPRLAGCNMALLTRCFTALTLAFHVLVGCCAHHDHSARDSAFSAQEVSLHRHSHGDEACEHQHHGDSEESGPCEPKQECNGDECVVVIDSGPSSSIVKHWDSVVAVHAPTSVKATDDCQSYAVEALHECGPPLRAHLLNQVLLI